MPFTFTSEHAEFERAVADIARKEFYDGYLARATSDEPCRAEVAKLGEAGLLGLGLPEAAGGQGADPISVGIAVEQLARADIALASLVAQTSALPSCLWDGLPRHVGEPVLRSLISGQSVMALALTEPGGGSDLTGMSVTARPADGGYRLFGEKTSVTLGMWAEHAIVVARAEGDGPKTRRFLVPLGGPDIARQQFQDPGFRPLGRAALGFDGTFVPADHEIGGPRSGLSAQLADLDFMRTLIGLMCVGLARRAMDETVEWVRRREAFGVPIARHQGVSFTLAEHETRLEAARLLSYRSLALRAAGERHSREASMCKWWAPQLAVQAVNDCIVIHGHTGWSNEMPLQQLLLDVSGLQIGDGTPQIQKLVIARELIGREYTG
ncbi:acyl-CoA dehydrogenase [Spongiactinospora rosea]|uniref:Acyl-CoA dehydrogenase n=1 Tax=Spongiactinospora rosea TaxID=2248750 RepID=A0A366LWH3_9ACTN|nr:acyl-CoA dehydrogenase family protein [Spongiactinospora rosea]RBQ18271.1 acyl-CoA dehydrogenase [Spongiactinospora rosea]